MVTIRPWNWSDAGRLTSLINNRNIWNNVRDQLPFPYTLKNADIYLQHNVEQKPPTSYAIEWNGLLTGGIGYIPKDDVYKCSAEIGYWVGEEFWGKGIVSAAIGLLVDRIQEQAPMVVRVYAEVFDYNKASMRALEKNGFYLEAIRKKAVIKNNIIIDDFVWVRLLK
jgi:[ribosomal protein S5]-alanine N-acetyltransferase